MKETLIPGKNKFALNDSDDGSSEEGSDDMEALLPPKKK